MQMEFLNSRLKNELEANQIRDSILLLDRCIYEDYHIFAKSIYKMGYTTEEEFEEYVDTYHEYIKQVKQPDIFIYVKASTKTLVDRIQRRGRDCEQRIDVGYLDTLTYYYDKFFDEMTKSMPDSKVIIIDTNDLNADEVHKVVHKHLKTNLELN